MDSDKTIIYYTANTEDPAFEQRIRDDLKKKAGSIPIISVSRKPIDLGYNICVGGTEVSYSNEWKQLLIGLRAANTKFCMTAEADCLYPEDYFNFIPPRDDTVYYYDNIYIVWKFKGGFWKKTGHCEGAEICGREYWIKRLEKLLPKTWDSLPLAEANKLVRKFFPREETWTGEPIISFKTRDGMSYRTTFINNKLKEIPYWGTIEELKRKFL
jgi:hypothetical protein